MSRKEFANYLLTVSLSIVEGIDSPIFRESEKREFTEIYGRINCAIINILANNAPKDQS